MKQLGVVRALRTSGACLLLAGASACASDAGLGAGPGSDAGPREVAIPGVDTDGDTISDEHEGAALGVDTDGDATSDYLDGDSDEDGLSDAAEAGDADLTTPPVDSDGDGIADYRDPDSDNDGLSDRDEVATHGTMPTVADTDGDGVTDLIEVTAGTDASDPMDSPRTRGDFVFLVPFEEDPSPSRDTLSFRTNIAFADIYFLFDKSSSMKPETDALRDAVVQIVNDLECVDTGTGCAGDSECTLGTICSPFTDTCVSDPEETSCVLSAWTGVGRYGSGFANDLNLQSNPRLTEAAMNWNLNGSKERLFQSLTSIAEPGTSGVEEYGTCPAAPAGRVGCPQFRDEAKRIVVVFTDEDSDGGSDAQAGAALQRAGITLIAINSGGNSAEDELRDVLRESGSVDRNGGLLYFEGEGIGVVAPVVRAINEIVEGVPLEVTIEAANESGDALQFIERLETNTTEAGCEMLMTADSDGDGVDDTFPSVTPGTTVCYDVVPRRNTTVMPDVSPLVFEARLTVRGDGSPVDERRVFFLVPPRIELPILY